MKKIKKNARVSYTLIKETNIKLLSYINGLFYILKV